MNVGYEAECALCADNQFGQVENAGFAIPDIPEVVASGVLSNVRLGGLDLIIMFVDLIQKVCL